MSGMQVLIQKEWLESMRNGKWIWLPIAFAILAMSQPLTMYYMPQLLEIAGGLPEGAVIDIPAPSGEEVLSGVLSQYTFLGTLLFVLAAMNVIVHERNNGSIIFISVRPVSALSYILSKWISLLVLYLISFMISFVIAWYYTNILFSMVSAAKLFGSIGIYSIWLCFLVALVLSVSTFLKSNSSIAGVSIGILAILALASELAPVYMKWSPTQLQSQAVQALQQTIISDLWLPITVTVLVTIFLLCLAIWRMKQWDYSGH
ncbi:ABC transporter permease [Oceanobacillus sp. CFH 90083]|uniref:ABC transporter permease n=1 Tax=Oceanobacillus sp. CFH 90083 TaxID=2592336 RepID=UPI00128C483A|nr:ABC transporter permease subunit [Oceanobacillus sp. CFH 90083]